MRHVPAKASWLAWLVWVALGTLSVLSGVDLCADGLEAVSMLASTAMPKPKPAPTIGTNDRPASSRLSVMELAAAPVQPQAGKVSSDWRPQGALARLPLSAEERLMIAAHRGRLMVGIAPNLSPPLDIMDLRRGVYSMSVDFVEAVGVLLGMEIEWRSFDDRAAMLAALQAHTIDIMTSATRADGDGVLQAGSM